MDKLIVNGLGKHLDGEYDFDLGELVSTTHPDAMTMREREVVKGISGIRMGEVSEALAAYDSSLLLALAVVLLRRKGKEASQERLLDSRILLSATDDVRDRTSFVDAKQSFIEFSLEPEAQEEDEDEASPPAEPATTPETETRQTSGGPSSNSTSDHPENDPSRTGAPDSERSATLHPVSLVH